VVVGTVDPHPVTWGLAPAELHERTGIPGGIRTMHELAVAAAASGRSVELRGAVSRPVFEALAGAAGARPELPAHARPPSARDIVVIPEGGEDPLRFARYVLSPARLVIALLAPPGQFGWPFVSPWRAQPHLTVALDTLARPEHFRAMAALGIDTWTHMTRVHELARAVGASCEFIGSGDPVGFGPPPAVKDIPVAYLEANRWRSLAEEVAHKLRTPARMIPAGDHETVMATLARARVLLLPARVEGDGRLLREARARGTVVVGLSSQVYATGLDEAAGAIAVDSLERMPEVVETLLGDPERLRTLAEAGRRSALAQVDWARYVERVDAAIAASEGREDDAAASARAEFGERLGEMLGERLRAIDRVAELDAQLAAAVARVRYLDGELASAGEALSELGSQLEQARRQLDLTR
jgi:Glycosyl transferases group 1